MNQYIDHTLLLPSAKTIEINTLCKEAQANQFFLFVLTRGLLTTALSS